MATEAVGLRERVQAALGGAYTIRHELGGGGMSRVFVADEAALGRTVVVKVLRPELAEGLSAERFKREVRLAARLQHPHVVPLLAAGALDGGVLYYTMPFVEGESLRARLEREGALPVADAIGVLRDVASALAYAHAHGVVHRDIKPENVLLSHGGAVVADFGIAKAISASLEGADGETDTVPSTLTAAGTSLGTPAYMAPEQATGDIVDHRADLYALGVVAYEMIAGRAPFEGRSMQQLLAAHATQAPEPLARRRATVPAALGTLVMQLLEKNPADRLQSADAVLGALEGIADAPRPAAASSAPARAWSPGSALRTPGWIALAAVGGAAVGATLGARRPAPDATARPVIAALTAPDGYELRRDGGLALSPDGARLAFVAADARGAMAIWVRPLDELIATRVEGTDGGSSPFWSPDGGSIGFFAGGRLRVADLRGGTRRTLCPAPRPGGGTWSPSGTIVYSPDFLGLPLFRVPATGGACTQLTRYRPGDFDHRRPSALPDGRRVLFSSFRANTALVVDLATGELAEVRTPGNEAQFVAPHWLLFRDGIGQAGPLFAQRIDLRTLRPVGEPRVVLNIGTIGISGPARYTATSRVLVAVQASGRPWSLLRVDRQSVVTDSITAPTDAGPLANAANAGMSRDGRSVAFGGVGMWIHDRDRNVTTRVRAETLPGQGILDPVWGPGDSVIAYSTAFRGALTLRVYRVATGTSDSLFAVGRRALRVADWSPDGRRIAFHLAAGGTAPKDELWVYSLAERRAVRAFEEAGNLSSARWSPHGQWMAFVSDEMGAPAVYVRRLDGAGAAVTASAAGGDFPRWRADGRELYYRAPNGAIMAVSVRLGATAVLSRPRVVVASPPFSLVARAVDVAPDGDAFFGFGREEPPVFTIVLDWAARLPAR